MNNFCYDSIFMVPVMSGHFLDCLALCGIPENCVEFRGKIDNSFLSQKCSYLSINTVLSPRKFYEEEP
jgi:hypothetical protein